MKPVESYSNIWTNAFLTYWYQRLLMDPINLQPGIQFEIHLLDNKTSRDTPLMIAAGYAYPREKNLSSSRPRQIIQLPFRFFFHYIVI